MRFTIKYKDFKDKGVENKSLQLVETFLNEHLIGNFYGHTYKFIIIRFLNNARPNKKLTLKTLYQTFAEIELADVFEENYQINLKDFQTGLSRVEEGIKLVESIKPHEKIDYQRDLLLRDYREALSQAPQALEPLLAYADQQDEIRYHNTVKYTNGLLDLFKAEPRPLTKQIRGVRVFDHFPTWTLAPFSYIYAELFGNLLRRAEVKLPGYEEIYFSIAETMEQAKQSVYGETWHKYTYSTLDLAKYHAADDEGKSQMVLESICDGLRLIADFDHLEKEKIVSVIEYVKANGTGVELVFIDEQNSRYLAEVIYRVPEETLAKAEYRLRLIELESGKSGIVHLDFVDPHYAPYSFAKIQLKKEEIIIKGRGGMRGEVSRKADGLPDGYRFKIRDVIR